MLTIKRLSYEGKGDVTVISDGEECLKRLKSVHPQRAKHILNWFHIAMKLRPIEQTSKCWRDDCRLMSGRSFWRTSQR
jgi:hypothetical protein